MESLSATERDRALLCIGSLCAFRAQNRPENEIAERLSFQSVGEMERQLEQWGLPEWIVRDSSPSPKQAASAEDKKPSRARKAKKFGPKVPLPPAEKAIPLFRGRMQLLTKKLELLRGLEEYLQSERFVGESERDGRRRVWGAQQAPPEPLTTLIALEALATGSVTTHGMVQLLDVLHPSELIEERKPFRGGGTITERRPDPQKVNLEQLQEQIRKLREAAENVARLVRGVESVRRGRRTDPIPTRLHAAYNLVKQRTKEGCSEEDVLEEANRRLDRDPLLEAVQPGAEDLTLNDVRYLKSLNF